MSEAGGGRPFVLGVTGNIACGKSSVMRLLGKRGAQLIDADEVYHALIEPGLPLWRALRERFGEAIVGQGGRIDRGALGKIVFADRAALADLDRLTHPAVTEELRRRIGVAQGPLVAVDAVKLVEGGFAAECDRLWVVTCEPAQQVARLMARNGLTRAEADARVAAQPPLGAKLAAADAALDNSGEPAALAEQVAAAWEDLPGWVRGLRLG